MFEKTLKKSADAERAPNTREKLHDRCRKS